MSLFRRFLKQDKGSMLIEAIVSVGIISTLTLGYTSLAANATVTQRAAVNQSIATQAVQDALEQARSIRWENVGTTAAPGIALPSGIAPVTGGTIPSVGPQETVRGLGVQINTAVGWQAKPSGTSVYGVKIVIAEVSWYDVAGDPATKHTHRQQIRITPTVGEAVPDGIRGAAGPALTSPEGEA